MQASGPSLGRLLVEAASFKQGKKFFIDTMCPGCWLSGSIAEEAAAHVAVLASAPQGRWQRWQGRQGRQGWQRLGDLLNCPSLFGRWQRRQRERRHLGTAF